MQDHESPEAVAARASQEDPIVMYAIVRESLNMSAGKIAAQCMHAAQMLHIEFSKIEKELLNMEDLESSFGSLSPTEASSWEKLQPQYYIYSEWLNSSFRKVVLRADDKEWEKVKAEFKEQRVIVVDAGLTEIPSGSETVIGLWPMRKSQAPKTIKRLQVLK